MKRSAKLVAFAALATLAVGVAGILVSCGSRTTHAQSTYRDPYPLPTDTLTFWGPEIGTYGGRFVIGQTNPPKTFNPLMANETSSTDINTRMYAFLVDYDNARECIYPELAKSWEMTPDQLTWTFHLRHGAQFSDGHPISAQDVLFSFEIAYDETLHPAVQDLVKVRGQRIQLSAPDSFTVVMKLPSPYSVLPSVLASLSIIPKHRLDGAYRRGDFASVYGVNTPPDSLVTSGAWRLKHYAPGEKTVLERNPYWLGVDAQGQRLPYLDELVYLIVPDQNTAALKFQSGDLDALDNVKPEDYKTNREGQQRGAYTVHTLGPALTTNFMWFNLNKVREPKAGKRVGDPQVDPVRYAWFSNPVFRRAVSMAIDRDAIIRGPFFGDGVKNWSQSTAGNKVWYTPDVVHYDHDPEQARQLLAGLGWKDRNGDGILEDTGGHPISFTVKSNGDNAVRSAMMNLIKDDLAKVGIRCIPAPVDFNTLITNLRQDFQYEALLLGLQSGTPPEPTLSQNVWKSSGLTHYWNIRQPKPETPAEAEIDRLMDAMAETTDVKAQQEMWLAIENIVNQQGFLVWLPTLKAEIPIRDKFGNLRPSVIPHRVLWNIYQVFSKPQAGA